MTKKCTKAEFIEKCRKIHGDKYDYSKVVYVNNKTCVEIICPKHGTFWQRPDAHIHSGCLMCGIDKKKGLIRGVAVNGTSFTKAEYSVRCWLDMLRRCYPVSEREKRVFSAYKDCSVAKEWLTLSNFLYWFDTNYRKGYVLDKDLLANGTKKIYSPDTCCFIPPEINGLLQTEHPAMQSPGKKRFFNKSKGYFEPKLFHKGKTIPLGKAQSEAEAVSIYKTAKNNLSTRWQRIITTED